MKQLFENKKLMIGIAIGLILIIGVVLYFVFRSGATTTNNTVSTNTDATPNNVTTKQVADSSGGIVSASSAASKGTLFV